MDTPNLQPCRLCATPAELQQSHIVPAFLYRWLRETSATGHIRSLRTPNRRTQDGEKRPWLCKECELLLSKDEREFANRLFYPIQREPRQRIRYGPWLLRFCASLSWRSATRFADEDELYRLSPHQTEMLHRARAVWRDFLLGRRRHPGDFRHHILHVPGVVGYDCPRLPEHFNSYLLRSIDTDLPSSDREVSIFTKLPGILIFGVVEANRSSHWKDTRVSLGEGFFGDLRSEAPGHILEYLQHRCRKINNRCEDISPAQHQKISDTLLRDPDRALQSKSVEAKLFDWDLEDQP